MPDYRQLAAQMRAEHEQQLSATLYSVADSNPDEEAGLLKLSKQTGIPLDALRLQSNKQDAQRTASASRYRQIIDSNPSLSEWLATPDNAAIAHDDTDNMGVLETLVNSFRRGLPSLAEKWHTLRVENERAGLDVFRRVDERLAKGEDALTVLREEGERSPLVPMPMADATPGQALASYQAWKQKAAPRLASRLVEQAQGITQAGAERDAIPMPPDVQRIMDAPTFGAQVGEFFNNPVRTIAAIGPESLVQQGPALLAGVLTRNPALTGALMGANSGTVAYAGELLDGLREAGVNVNDPKALAAAFQDEKIMGPVRERAGRYAAVVGAVDAASAGVASKLLLPDRVLAASPFARELANIGVQIPVQGAFGAAGEAAGQVASGQEINTGEILLEAVGEAFTAPAEVASASSKRLTDLYVEHQTKRAQAQANGQTMQQLVDTVNASKLKQRAPEKLQEFLRQAAEQGGGATEVYIDARKFSEALNQDGVDAVAILGSMPETAKQLDEALAAGSDLVVPIDEALANLPGTPLEQVLIDHSRVDPDGISMAEAAEVESVQSLFQQQAEQIMQQEGMDSPVVQAGQQVYDNILTQLNETGRFSADVNQQYAKLMQAFYTVTASRSGMTADQFMERYPLRIGAKLPGQSGAQLDQQDTPDTTVDAAETGKPWAGVVLRGETGGSYGVAATDAGDYGKGRYFTGDESRAQAYARGPIDQPDAGGKVVQERVVLRNPLVFKTSKEALEYRRSIVGPDLVYKPQSQEAAALIDADLRAKGYDGVVVYDGEGNYTATPEKPFEVVQLGAQQTELNQSAQPFDGPEQAATPLDPNATEIEVDGVMRPAQNSNGQPIHWSAEGVRNFWRWFGESKVVDEQGRPLVVYHGTTADFDAFRDNQRGVQFVSPSAKWVAKFYTDEAGDVAQGANVMPVYVRAENPFDYENKKHVNLLAASASLGKLAVDQIKAGSWARLEDRTTLAAIKKRFDGLYVSEEGNKNLAVFDPTQIKSATGNRGTFARSDANILNQGDRNRGAFNPSTLTITLLEAADFSTFLHESAHFFLTVYEDLALQPDATPEIQQDVDALLKWMGVEAPAGQRRIDVWAGFDLEQKREGHEQFAESFEQWLFGGEAPSVELQSVFQRFATWMVRVYKSLKQFMASHTRAKLEPEIEQIFSRMLASEEQIKTAEQMRSLLPKFASAEEMGVAAEEYADYIKGAEQSNADATTDYTRRSLRDMQWMSNAKAKAIKALQKEAAEMRAAMRKQVEAEVMAEPVYAAMAFLRDGVLPEANRTNKQRRILDSAAGMSTKLSLPALKEMYGDNPSVNWQALPKGKRGMVASDGMHPDDVAALFGWASGDALVRALLDAEPMDQVVDAITDQRMLEQHGELSDPVAIERAAESAIHNPGRLRMVATELAAVLGDLGRMRPLMAAAKSYGEKIAGRLPITKLRPAKYTNASAKAGRLSLEALRKGDRQLAAVELRNQMLNIAAARSVMEAADETRKALELFRKIMGGNDDVRAKTRNMDIVNAARAILAAYQFGSDTRGKTAQQYIEAIQAYDPEMAASLRPAIDAATANAKPYNTMTVDELRALRDEIASLWELSRSTQQIEIDGQRVSIDAAQGEMFAKLQENGIPDRIPGEGSAVTPAEKRQRKLLSYFAALRRVESWVRSVDGPGISGPFRKYVWNPVKEAADRYRADKLKYTTRYRELLDTIAPGLRTGTIDAPELGYTFGKSDGGMAKVEILHALLHTGNGSNLRKMLLGRGWAAENPDGTLDTRRWDAFVQRMAREGVLTKADMDFVQSVWDLLDEIKPLAQRTHRAVFGRYFNEVTAEQVNTPWGTYRGGYVPAQVDTDAVRDADLRKLAETENENMAYAFPATNRGFTQSRVEYNRPLLLDLRALSQHIDKVLLFAHMEQPVREVRRVLSGGKLGWALGRTDPTAFASLITPWLNRAARQRVTTTLPGDGGLLRGFGVLRNRAGMAAMFANVVNAAQQITGFSIAAVRVPKRELVGAMAQWVKGPRAMAQSVAELSPFMANRMHNEVGAMVDAMNEILLNPSAMEKARVWFKQHAYFLQSAVANTMEPVIWTAAYNHALSQADANLTPEQQEREAIRYADSTVRETQGSTLPEDVSRIETGNDFVRLFTQFMGYFNMQANLLGTEFVNIRREFGLKAGAGRLFYVYLFGFLVPAVASELIVQAFRGGPEDEDDDGYLDDWLAATLVMPQIRTATAMVPVIGPGAMSLVNATNSKPYDDRISTSPAISMLESAARGAVLPIIAAGDSDISNQKAVRDVATLLSLTLGVPVSAAARPVGYLAGVEEGRIEPTSPADAARGLITGVASPESRGR